MGSITSSTHVHVPQSVYSLSPGKVDRSFVMLGVLMGAYHGGVSCGNWTRKFCSQNNDASRLKTLCVGLSIIAGGLVGAAVGGSFVIAFVSDPAI